MMKWQTSVMSYHDRRGKAGETSVARVWDRLEREQWWPCRRWHAPCATWSRKSRAPGVWNRRAARRGSERSSGTTWRYASHRYSYQSRITATASSTSSIHLANASLNPQALTYPYTTFQGEDPRIWQRRGANFHTHPFSSLPSLLSLIFLSPSPAFPLLITPSLPFYFFPSLPCHEAPLKFNKKACGAFKALLCSKVRGPGRKTNYFADLEPKNSSRWQRI